MVEPALLNRGKVEAMPFSGGGTFYYMVGQGVGTTTQPDNRISCAGADELNVEVQMTGAVAADLAVDVFPYQADGVTVLPAPMQVISSPATNPSFASGKCYFYSKYDVSGLDAVQIRIKNNNAGAQTLDRASWRLV
jgi:hypothetical protein